MCVHADDMSVVVPYRDLNPDPYHGKPQNLTNLTMYGPLHNRSVAHPFLLAAFHSKSIGEQ